MLFDQFGEDTQAYGYAASFGLTESCEREVSTSPMSYNVAQPIMQAATGVLPQMISSLPNKTRASSKMPNNIIA